MAGYLQVRTVRERIEDALREIGTLLITFAPLDAVIGERRALGLLLLFALLGAFLLILAIVLERSRARGH